jgi:hypothetical protein
MQSASTSVSLDRSVSTTLYLWGGGLVLLAALGFLLIQGQFHLLAAVAIGLCLICVSALDKRPAVLLTFTFLFLMGDIRRLISVAEPQPQFDPILLVGPTMAVYLAVPYLARLNLRDKLSKMMLALLFIMVLEIVNPLQGGLSVGLSGAFFYIVPTLWFWVGRGLASPAFVERLLYKIIVPLAVVASILGICQTLIGFLPFEQAWINSATRVYTSLYIGASIRAFGFSVNAAEYATLLALGLLTVVAGFLAGNRVWILLAPPLVVALLLESSRGFIVKSVFALAVVLVLRKGQRFKASTVILVVVAGAVALASMSFVASRLAPAPNGAQPNSTQDALSHQLDGLGHPFDPKYSTAGTHLSMVASSLTRGLTHPLGFGLGYTTFAAEKLSAKGPIDEGSSELDLSDMFTALGLIGGSIYLLIAFYVVQGTIRYIRIAPLRISLPLLAIVFESIGGWLVGGQYSSSALLFFLFGALAYANNHLASSQALVSLQGATGHREPGDC